MSSKLRETPASPRYPFVERIGRSVPSPHCFRKNAELNKDDRDKLWEAYELGQKLDEPGTVVPEVSGFQQRLDADLARMIQAWAPLSLSSFLETSRKELREAASQYKCEAVLFCVVDGQVHVDSENHGPQKPCGRAPATALTKSLEFLSIALSTYKGEACAVLYAPGGRPRHDGRALFDSIHHARALKRCERDPRAGARRRNT